MGTKALAAALALVGIAAGFWYQTMSFTTVSADPRVVLMLGGDPPPPNWSPEVTIACGRGGRNAFLNDRGRELFVTNGKVSGPNLDTLCDDARSQRTPASLGLAFVILLSSAIVLLFDRTARRRTRPRDGHAAIATEI